MIIRGTTPKIEFDLPFSAEELKEVELTIAQKREVLYTKYKKDMEFNGYTGSVRLSQEETLAFNMNIPIQLQLRIQINDGRVFGTKAQSISPYDLLKNEVLK